MLCLGVCLCPALGSGTTIYLWAVELFETPVRTTGMGAAQGWGLADPQMNVGLSQ